VLGTCGNARSGINICIVLKVCKLRRKDAFHARKLLQQDARNGRQNEGDDPNIQARPTDCNLNTSIMCGCTCESKRSSQGSACDDCVYEKAETKSFSMAAKHQGLKVTENALNFSFHVGLRVRFHATRSAASVADGHGKNGLWHVRSQTVTGRISHAQH